MDTMGAARAAGQPGVRAYLRGAPPARMRLARPRRAPDLLLTAEPGFYPGNERPSAVRAVGGYSDAASSAPDMCGEPLVRGPNLRAGAPVQRAGAVGACPLLPNRRAADRVYTDLNSTDSTDLTHNG